MAPLHCSLGRKLKFEWEYEALYVNAKALLLVTEDWYFASHRLLRADRIREKWQEHLSGDPQLAVPALGHTCLSGLVSPGQIGPPCFRTQLRERRNDGESGMPVVLDGFFSNRS